MASLSRWHFAPHWVFPAISFILTLLSLLSGYKQGFMEDYAIVRVNTSMVGRYISHKLTPNASGVDPDRGDNGLLGDLKDWLHHVEADTSDKLSDLSGNIAEELADKLGLSQWYSLHVTDFCQGLFTPNATAVQPSLNVTNCTRSSPSERFNLTRILDHSIRLGPLAFNLADIDWPDGVQEHLETLNRILNALFAVYVFSVILTAISVLLGVVAFVNPIKPMVTINMIFALAAAMTCLVGSGIVTVSISKGVTALNGQGRRVGLVAERGQKFCTMTWVATTFMIVVAGFWIWQKLPAQRQSREPVAKHSARTTG